MTNDKQRIRALRKEGVRLQTLIAAHLNTTPPRIKLPLLAAVNRRINRLESLDGLSFLIGTQSMAAAAVYTDMGRFIAAIEAQMGIPEEDSVYQNPKWQTLIMDIDLLTMLDDSPVFISDDFFEPQLDRKHILGGMSDIMRNVDADYASHPFFLSYASLLFDIVLKQSTLDGQQEVSFPKFVGPEETYTVYVTSGERSWVRFRIYLKNLTEVLRQFVEWEQSDVPDVPSVE